MLFNAETQRTQRKRREDFGVFGAVSIGYFFGAKYAINPSRTVGCVVAPYG